MPEEVYQHLLKGGKCSADLTLKLEKARKWVLFPGDFRKSMAHYHLDFGPVKPQTSNLHNCKVIYLYGFKPLCLLLFVMMVSYVYQLARL